MSVIVILTERDAQSPLRKDHKRDINFKSSFLRHFLREFARRKHHTACAR
jgi:hypothetical protein